MPRLDASHPEDAIAKFLALLPPELNPLIAAVRAAVGIGPQLDGEARSAMHVLRYRKVWGSGLARAGMYLLCEVLPRLFYETVRPKPHSRSAEIADAAVVGVALQS
jgi:hypothetical protein